MDKEKWIADKIKKLLDEGKTQAQAEATAESMWTDRNDSKSKEMLLDQKAVNYTTVSGQVGKACAGCRWFETYGSEYSRQDECHLVRSYPLAIEPTGLCDRYEATPEETPLTMTPMPVVIVEPETAEDDSEALEATGMAELKTGAEKSLTDRIWQRIKARLSTPQDDSVGFKVKGNHWIAWWSNNFKDRDDELFTAKAIDAYVKRVDMGIVEPPALAIWHLGEKSYIGQAAWVARHGHSVMAAGEFDAATKERVKAYYRKNASKTALSHGFTFPKSSFKDGVYHAFNSFEISLLPRGVEANSYTSLEGVKAMPVTKEKQEYLKEVGYTDEEITDILASREARDKAIEATGEAFKDFTDPDQTETAPDAIDAVSKAFKDLFPELIEADADNAEANLKMAKVVAAQQTDLSAIKASLAKIEAFISQTPKRASKAAETEIDPEDEDDAKDFLSRYEDGQVDEKLVKALGASAFDKSDFRKSLSQHGINLR